MEEILPGLIHWSAFHDGDRTPRSQQLFVRFGTLLDPMEPEGGLDAIAATAVRSRSC